MELKELVRGSVGETPNEPLEAENRTQATRYERNAQRQGYRSKHYNRNFTTTLGNVTLKVPNSKKFLLKLQSLSGIAAGGSVWKKHSL